MFNWLKSKDRLELEAKHKQILQKREAEKNRLRWVAEKSLREQYPGEELKKKVEECRLKYMDLGYYITEEHALWIMVFDEVKKLESQSKVEMVNELLNGENK